MKLSKFFAYLLFVLLISFVACSDDDDEPNSAAIQVEFQKELEAMDALMSDMISSSDAFFTLFALSDAEEAPINLDLTDPFALLGEIQGAFGTHTYVSTGDTTYWDYSDQPSNEVILIVPLTSEKTSTIRLYDFDLSNSEASFKMSLASNDVVSFTAAFSIVGTELLNPFSEPMMDLLPTQMVFHMISVLAYLIQTLK